MDEIRYADDKPKDCRYCYYWGGRIRGCTLKKENCYYILPPKKVKKNASPCEGCPYGEPHPCIGYCLRKLMAGTRQKGAER